jgi:uroporphyrinogen decarboxylase
MTDRERFNAQMHYEPVDRCFNMEFGYWKENYETWPMFVENGITKEGQANAYFNFDTIHVVGGKTWLCPQFEWKVVEETETTRVMQNGDGLLGEVPKDGHATIPHFIESSIKGPEDWKRVKAEKLDPDHPDRKVDIEQIKSWAAPDRDFPVGVNCGSMIGKVRDLLTFEGLCYACYDYPEMVEDMVETCCVLVENFLDQVLGHVELDFASGWEDICFKQGPIVTVDFFEKIIVPRYKRIGAKLAENGIDIWYTDCDGDIRPIIHCFLESGINTMFPFEVNCSGHPGELLDKYGKDLRIMGGVDKMVLGKDPAAIREYLETLVPYVQRGGFIPHCDHRCPPNVSQENYLAYLDIKEELFGM